MQKTQTLIFTLTVFLSAYLLFVIQPIVGKIILPVLGGTPSVWNTTMMFFQILLLGGYLYAHTISKIKSLKIQFAIHTGLILLAGLVTLPMATTMTPPENADNPLVWQVGVMSLMIGLPFLFLSASAPLLQRWFSRTTHPDADNPYFLYAASNIGSVLALALYPLLVERYLPLPDQSIFWSGGYIALMIFVTVSAISAIRSPRKDYHEEADILEPHDKESPDWKTIALWLLLSFVPSSLMLSYTSYMTSDIGSLPLFWVIPLALYILSFVIAFSRKTIIPLPVTRAAFAFLTAVIFAMMGSIYYLKLQLGMGLGLLFFVTAIMCHQELVRLKPTTHHLTLFYLIMSVGGALGGIFNALIAPIIFVRTYEIMLTLGLALFCWNLTDKLSFASVKDHKTPMLLLPVITILSFISFAILKYAFGSNYQLIMPLLGLINIPLILILMDRRPYFIMACLIVMLATPIIPWEGSEKIVQISRNYFGTLTTTDNGQTRNLSHGMTLHGSQPTDPKYKTIPLTYYNPKTAIGEAFHTVESNHKEINVAGLGLGTGSVACLLRKQDKVSFYEIDPEIIKIASDPNIFSYLHDCPPTHDIIQGDARLELQNAPDHSYDLLLVDVFSSDSIPLHMMTREATEMYLQKTKENGLLIFHISSRSFQLAYEVGAIADSLNIPALFRSSQDGQIGDTDYMYSASDAVILTKNPGYIKKLKDMGWVDLHGKEGWKPWTDDYVNPLRSLNFNAFTPKDDKDAVSTSSQKSE